MGAQNLAGVLEVANQAQALRWHLQCNLYPPVPASFVPVCEQAIELACSDDWDELVELPAGTSYRGADVAPVWAIVESHHLEQFIG